MTCALAIVALAGWLQMVTLGASPSHTESGFETTVSAALSPGAGQFEAARAEPEAINSGQGPQEPSHLDLYVLGNYPKIFGNSQSSLVEAASVRVSSQGGQLTEAEAIETLQAAGWPTELIPQALAVAWCESKWSPAANGDSGRSKGWFQLNTMWFGYAGEDPEQWGDPLVNARTALAVYRYEQARGYAPFANWSCRTALN